AHERFPRPGLARPGASRRQRCLGDDEGPLRRALGRAAIGHDEYLSAGDVVADERGGVDRFGLELQHLRWQPRGIVVDPDSDLVMPTVETNSRTPRMVRRDGTRSRKGGWSRCCGARNGACNESRRAKTFAHIELASVP